MKPLFPVDEDEVLRIAGIEVTVPGGMRVPSDYAYVPTKDYLVEKCMAAWNDFDGEEMPMAFRLVGDPGVGKNEAVYSLAARTGKPLFIVLGNEELTAEDLVVSAALDENQKIRYVASPLLAAMLKGGICFIDEIAKMRPKALAPLSSVLDPRRSITCGLIGKTFFADPGFRFCAAYNPTDADAFDLAPWLRRRTSPEFRVSTPDLETLEKIVLSHELNGDRILKSLTRRLRQRNGTKELVIDPGTAVRLVAYVRRLTMFQQKNACNLGDVYDLAIEHILTLPQNEKL